jgi:MoaA/NifB/PqqE/SkfB family radical SAM enzyme
MAMKTDRKSSFTAADVFPLKLAQDYRTLKSIVKRGWILPIHLQLAPTNRCTRNCSFCSCSDRDKSQELSLDYVKRIIATFKVLDTKAVTITGGGDPLCHPDIDKIIDFFAMSGIHVGIVTNADLIDRMLEFDRVKWCRISCSDDVAPSDEWWSKVQYVVNRFPNVDWAFSYVVTERPDYDNMNRFVEFAERYRFTHVRIVSDILSAHKIPKLIFVKEAQDLMKNPLVIYQGRKEPTRGREKCLISLLKPVVDASGRLFPCCGTQYARKDIDHDFATEMLFGELENAINIWQNQKYFDGSRCDVCYYEEYNAFLNRLTQPLEHRRFV